MAAIFPNGSIFAISAALGSAVTVSGISNANPGVATATAHGFSNADILVLSNSGRLDQRVVRAANVATNTFELEGVNTTSTTLYPSGFGVGSVQEAATFTALSQTIEVNAAGGEQQFSTWQYIEDNGAQRQRPTFRNARSITNVMHYDPSLAWHDVLIAASETQDVRVLRIALPNGRKLYYSVYVGYDGQPEMQVNENMGVRVSFSLANPYVTEYSS